MANTLGAYNQVFYANEALIWLRKVLGMAGRVHRGYDTERQSFERGEPITIRRPATFVAQAAPSSAQNLNTGFVNLNLDRWEEVKFELTDRELAYTGEQIIQEHIMPAAYALADSADQALAGLYKDVPWLHDYGAAVDHTIITGARQVAFDNQVPMNDGMLHMMVDGTVEAYFLNSAVFHSAQVAGAAAAQSLMMGALGTRFNVEVFASQNAPKHTPGTVAASGGDAAGAVDGAHAAGVTSLVVDSFTGSETLKAGDSFSIAGQTQRYAVTTDLTLTSGAGTLTISPPLAVAVAGTEIINFTVLTATAHTQQLLYHRNAFALAFAPLPMNLPGIEVFTAVDPVSGLAVRARRFAVGDSSKLVQALDILYGVKTLDPNLAVRAVT
jgi:hypothetical protein